LTAARIGGLVQLTWITTSPGTENLAPHYERKTTIPGLQAIFGIKGTYQDLDSLKNHLPKGTLAATQIPPPVATPNSPTLNDRTGA